MLFHTTVRASVCAAVLLTGACAGANGTPASTMPGVPAGSSGARTLVVRAVDHTSVLKSLGRQVTIGSTVDPVNGSQNPYGLTVAPVTAGGLQAGDLVVCNFNGRSNQQGSGRSLVALHPVAGATPRHLSQNQHLLGCDALALGSDDTIWAAAMAANDDPILSPGGKLLGSLSGKPFSQPWGQAFAAPAGGAPAFYESNAATGSIVRISLGSSFSSVKIATGFPRNHGVAGAILAPSGLSYDASSDTLYFADGQNNTLVGFSNVSTIPAGGIQATNRGMTFTGPNAANARIVYSGAPLNGPISTALLPNGNLVVGNTLDAAGENLLIEIASDGMLLDVRNVDTGAAGALFGLVATGSEPSNTKVYFNDDNANNVQVLER